MILRNRWNEIVIHLSGGLQRVCMDNAVNGVVEEDELKNGSLMDRVEKMCCGIGKGSS